MSLLSDIFILYDQTTRKVSISFFIINFIFNTLIIKNYDTFPNIFITKLLKRTITPTNIGIQETSIITRSHKQII